MPNDLGTTSWTSGTYRYFYNWKGRRIYLTLNRGSALYILRGSPIVYRTANNRIISESMKRVRRTYQGAVSNAMTSSYWSFIYRSTRLFRNKYPRLWNLAPRSDYERRY